MLHRKIKPGGNAWPPPRADLGFPWVSQAPNKTSSNPRVQPEHNETPLKRGQPGGNETAGQSTARREARQGLTPPGKHGAGKATGKAAPGHQSPHYKLLQGTGALWALRAERGGLPEGQATLTSHSPACSRASCRGRSRWSAGAPCRTRTGRTARATGCRSGAARTGPKSLAGTLRTPTWGSRLCLRGRSRGLGWAEGKAAGNTGRARDGQTDGGSRGSRFPRTGSWVAGGRGCAGSCCGMQEGPVP